MTKYILLSIIVMMAFGVLFTSCEKSEKIDDFPLVKPSLVVNALFSPDDSLILDISRSLSVLDNAPLKRVSQAKVVLYIDGIAADSLLTASSDNLYHLHVVPQMGKSYQVRVSHPNYDTVLSTSESLPEKVLISKTDILVTDSNSWWYFDGQDTVFGGYFQAKASVRFKDPASDGNFYVLRVLVVDTAESSNEEEWPSYLSSLSSNDLALDEASVGITSNSSSMLFFTDHIMNGGDYTIYLDLLDYGFRKSKLYFFELSSVSESAYLYLRTREAYNASQSDPFAEPVQVFSNINGGFGIFAGVNKTYFQFKP
jgi:hypothetical protein